MTDRDIRVALVAPQASARFGGESILPLHYFRHLRARGVEVWMVLHERTRDELQEVLGADFERILFVKDLTADRVLYRLSTFLPARVGENTFGFVMRTLTQWRQRALLKRLVREQGVNVVHEPTPVSPKIPSLIYGLGVPVVIGPMNGGMTFPPPFRRMQRPGERIFVQVARRTTSLLNRLLPGKRRADILLVANPRTRAALPVEDRGQVIELVENGVDFSVFDGSRTPRESGEREGTVELVFSGRLVDWKALDLLLEVLAGLTDLSFSLQVVGDGAERPRLEELTRRLGLEGRVKFHGFLPQKECAAALGRADVLVLPSLYECGGAVVLEAMAMGLPVIAHAWGGPADYVDEASGLLLDPTTSRAQLQKDWEAALRALLTDAEKREAMGRAGYARVRALFSWQKKTDTILALYRQAIEARVNTR